MSDQDILFPKQPILIVDRQYQRSKRSSKRVYDKEDVEISVYKNPVETSHKPSHQARRRVNSATNRPNVSSQKHDFIVVQGQDIRAAQQSCTIRRRPSVGVKSTASARRSRAVNDEEISPRTSLVRSVSPHGWHVPPRLEGAIQISQALELLAYYPRLFSSNYSLNEHLSFQFNPFAASWLPSALNDDALLTTIMLSSAINIKMTSPSYNGQEIGTLTTSALQIINERLTKDQLTDSTAAAVACLSDIQHVTGNKRGSQLHRNGMAEIVRLRGGTQAIEHSLRIKIYRSDMLVATDSLSIPTLPRVKKTLPATRELVGLQASGGSEVGVIAAASGISLQLVGLFSTLAGLTHAIDHAITHQISLNPQALDEDLLCLQYDLLLTERASSASGASVDWLGALTALIFVNTFAQSRSRQSSFYEKAASRIRDLLTQQTWLLDATFMLWCTYFGAIASRNSEHYPWFREFLRENIDINHASSWEITRETLRKVLWVSSLHEPMAYEIWRDSQSPQIHE